MSIYDEFGKSEMEEVRCWVARSRTFSDGGPELGLLVVPNEMGQSHYAQGHYEVEEAGREKCSQGAREGVEGPKFAEENAEQEQVMRGCMKGLVSCEGREGRVLILFEFAGGEKPKRGF